MVEEFPKPREKYGCEPCGECHLKDNEVCDICHAQKWVKHEGGVSFYNSYYGWANITSHPGSFVCAFVQPVVGGCRTGSFDTVARARSWAVRVLRDNQS